MPSLLLPTLLTLLCAAILVGLGTWQLNRLAWKEALIATIAQRTGAKPLELSSAAEFKALSAEGDEYRRVSMRGVFRNDDEVQVYALLGDAHGPYSGPGYWVLTPLEFADGSAVIVNRGFVPMERKEPASRATGRISGESTVTGLLRAPEQPNLFTPANDPGKNAWFNRDPGQIAKAFGLSRVAPFLVDADATPNPGGLPQGGETRVTFPNSHLEYALTWYGLALGLIGVYLAWVLGRRRQPANPPISGKLESPSRSP